MKEIKKLADPEIRVIEKVKNLLNEEQKLLKKGLNEEIKNAKLSYAEINEVLCIIDREQHYLANHRR
ncbi:hypothetical protein MTQ96_11005 [Staphylococcus agnetis]|uniref:hypothetical protein n=1 Tax=Staphylococcus agnetis TaxID=985762 RepID=UPI0014305C62|nr:hypothetical protein [Staphylococcus agnetis]MCO4357279.1 hypothetical protein [Staphylococcus agnetis]MCO4363261.1 hypothetical protein [Staphylococcus agnetis]NJH98619.1 hypothetical protein [Staphylococcus agnetis]